MSTFEVNVNNTIAWVTSKSGQTALFKELVYEHLGDAFYEIRFASMILHQLCTLHATYKTVLSNENFSAAADIISTLGVQRIKFNTSLRQAKWNDDAVIKCDHRCYGGFDHWILCTNEKTTFLTNRPIVLGSFTCWKIVNHQVHSVSDLEEEYPVENNIIEASDLKRSSAKVLSNSKAQLSSTATNVKLPQLILIILGFFYTISIGEFPEGYQLHPYELKQKVEFGKRY